MNPLFTIHGGEYLVGEAIERLKIKGPPLRVWVPSKDTGIDLLVTSHDCKKTLSLQVKFSRTYNCAVGTDAVGWWQIKQDALAKSMADYWVLVLPKYDKKKIFSDNFYFALSPKDLSKRLESIHGEPPTNKKGVILPYEMYLTVCGRKVTETRSLSKMGTTKDRDFSQYLNNLKEILKPLAY